MIQESMSLKYEPASEPLQVVDDGRTLLPQHRQMCSGSEAGSYLRLIDFVYHSIRNPAGG